MRPPYQNKSFIYLSILVIKEHREVVVPRFACILEDKSNTLTRTESGRVFLFNSRMAYKRLEAFLQMVAFTRKLHFKSFEMVLLVAWHA
jgi:hypothetical protein